MKILGSTKEIRSSRVVKKSLILFGQLQIENRRLASKEIIAKFLDIMNEKDKIARKIASYFPIINN